MSLRTGAGGAGATGARHLARTDAVFGSGTWTTPPTTGGRARRRRSGNADDRGGGTMRDAVRSVLRGNDWGLTEQQISEATGVGPRAIRTLLERLFLDNSVIGVRYRDDPVVYWRARGSARTEPLARDLDPHGRATAGGEAPAVGEPVDQVETFESRTSWPARRGARTPGRGHAPPLVRAPCPRRCGARSGRSARGPGMPDAVRDDLAHHQPKVLQGGPRRGRPGAGRRHGVPPGSRRDPPGDGALRWHGHPPRAGRRTRACGRAAPAEDPVDGLRSGDEREPATVVTGARVGGQDHPEPGRVHELERPQVEHDLADPRGLDLGQVALGVGARPPGRARRPSRPWRRHRGPQR